MYTLADYDRSKPPKYTKFLRLQPLCGLCKFKCCVSKGLSVETTEKESAELGLPREFPIAGKCRCLGESGCSLGDRKPVMCRLAPLQLKGDSLVVGHWFILNCPSPNDYEQITSDDGKYHYRLKDRVKGARRHNAQESFVLDFPLSDFPSALENNIGAVVELYGKEAAESLLQAMQLQREMEQGFDL